MKEDKIKTSFAKVKQDIFLLQSQISSLTHEIKKLKRTLDQTDTLIFQTDRQTDQTVPCEVEGFKSRNSELSTRNEGVQTDRQTDQQTDNNSKKFAQTQKKPDKIDRIKQVSEVIESLDNLKKELRQQFKKLTQQEMLIFSMLYQLTEQGLSVDYALLSQKTALSESSIRDYILKLIKKGIPVDKTKENNKRVLLTIPEGFRKMTTLATINSLRNL